jgi:hypothetical protein
VTTQCADAVGLLGQRSNGALRRVIEVFVPRISFGLETKAVEIEIALPSWAISKEPRIDEAVREAHRLVDGMMRPTHVEEWLPLVKYACTQTYVKRSPCISCNRGLRAA